jgi:EKC/KEOPS complex subunit PCC1/LAGE3
MGNNAMPEHHQNLKERKIRSRYGYGYPTRSRIPLLTVESSLPPQCGVLLKNSRTIDVRLPTARLASAALQALRVDKELSPLVSRTFSTVPASSSNSTEETILRTEYKATTNRMLRVAVNGFMESLKLALEVMEELDVDVIGRDNTELKMDGWHYK